MSKTYYDILEIPTNATRSDIINARGRIGKILFPKTQSGDAKAKDDFKALEDAFNTLMDPKKRDVYDRGLEERATKLEKTFTQSASPSEEDLKSEFYRSLDAIDSIVLKLSGLALKEKIKGNGNLLEDILSVSRTALHPVDVLNFAYETVLMEEPTLKRSCAEALKRILERDEIYISPFIRPAINLQIQGFGDLLDYLIENRPNFFQRQHYDLFEGCINDLEDGNIKWFCLDKLEKIKEAVSSSPPEAPKTAVLRRQEGREMTSSPAFPAPRGHRPSLSHR